MTEGRANEAMNLSELPASELARIDAICLDFEARLRAGASPSIDQLVEQKGGRYAELLRQELIAVRKELDEASPARAEIPVYDAETVDGELLSTLLSPGEVLGRYVIEATIGRGGMGVVYRASDQRLGRKVAIKMLSAEAFERPGLAERFEREAKAIAALTHPNIVELFDIGVRRGLPYAVMEFLDGESLDQRLGRGRLAAADVRKLGVQIADALAVAHRGGVIHRDLKPQNIMLVPRMSAAVSSVDEQAADEFESKIVKLFDFGLSRIPRDDLQSGEETTEGMILGTPGYMSPEQARGESVTAAADLFALGCILFEAFYGRRAFDGDTSAARFRATIDQQPEADPPIRRGDLQLADLIDQCLKKDPAERPATAAAIAERLRGHAGREGAANRRGDHVLRRRALLLGAGSLAAAGLGWWLVRPRGDAIRGIESLVVLSLRTDGNATAEPTGFESPLGDRALDRGEKFSAMLVHELTRLSDLRVPPFRPRGALTNQQAAEIGSRLGVDAVLTGRLRRRRERDIDYSIIDIELIASGTAERLWGKQVQAFSTDDFLAESKLASEIAAAIGHRLTATADQSKPPSEESFSCLIDGNARSDPESVDGLKTALLCFEKAHQTDRSFAEPLAGIALTSVTLAAQSPSAKSLALIAQARQAAADALQIDPTSIDARLAAAMLAWQVTNRYREAARALKELAMIAPNHWQVIRQFGLLMLAVGNFTEAARLLREASQLNPWSILAKVDRARASWFAGNPERAIADAIRIRDKHDGNLLARGLLVDIFESQQRFGEAAAEHPSWRWEVDDSQPEYLRLRQQRLIELPYGPFGDAMNSAILASRAPGGIGQDEFAELAEVTPPMLPLLLAVHPGFHAVRLLPHARELLPESV